MTVTFPDVPEAITQGDSPEEVAAQAEDALVTALSFYVDARQPLPRASKTEGRSIAEPPALVAVKCAT
jgi:antitoxin HicB